MKALKICLESCEILAKGVVFKKLGSDPSTDKGLKKVQEVGSTIRASGRSWKGKPGSEWVELDSQKNPGWLSLGQPCPAHIIVLVFNYFVSVYRQMYSTVGYLICGAAKFCSGKPQKSTWNRTS